MMLKQLGRYELVRVLGKGAMGLVYEGRDPNLDRQVAIKTISMDQISEAAAADYELRFRNEARSAGRLQHANIVSVYDAGRDGDIAYLVMEFIKGKDLKHYLDNGERYSLAQTLAIMEDLLAALSCAHSQNVVHRDVKPANLLVEKGGRVKLTDFGVARIQDTGDATRTQGTMVGTLKYMSPEQVKGLAIDTRADIFSAGVVLYQLLTGHRPFSGATDFAIIQSIVGGEYAPPTARQAGLPAALDAVVSKALAKSRELRFQTAAEFSSALLAACNEAVDLSAPFLPAALTADNAWSHTRPDGEWPAGLDTNTNTNTNVRSADTVTQELELVYWKDIRGTRKPRELQLFIEKFPSGVYVDLAMRRLARLRAKALQPTEPAAPLAAEQPRRLPAEPAEPDQADQADQTDQVGTTAALLSASTPAHAGALLEAVMPDAAPPATGEISARRNTGTSTRASTKPPAVPAVTLDESRARRSNARSRSASTGASEHAVGGPDAVNSGTHAPAWPGSKSGRKNTAAWPVSLATPRRVGLAGALALGVAGAVFGVQHLLVRPTAPTAITAIETHVVATSNTSATPDLRAAGSPTAAGADWSTNGAIAPALKATGAGAEAASAGRLPTARNTSTTSTASPAALSSTPSPTASRPANAGPAQRVAARPAAAAKSPSSAAPPVQPQIEPKSSRMPALASPSAPVVLAPPPPAGPEDACEGRVLFGFQMCMAEQCARPAFASHPVCQERTIMEERRRELERVSR